MKFGLTDRLRRLDAERQRVLQRKTPNVQKAVRLTRAKLALIGITFDPEQSGDEVAPPRCDLNSPHGGANSQAEAAALLERKIEDDEGPGS